MTPGDPAKKAGNNVDDIVLAIDGHELDFLRFSAKTDCISARSIAAPSQNGVPGVRCLQQNINRGFPSGWASACQRLVRATQEGTTEWTIDVSMH